MTDTDPNAGTDLNAGTQIVARAGTYYRWTRYLMSAMLVLGGLWFMYDGYIGWPELNRQIEQIETERLAAEDAGQTERATELFEQQKELGDRKNEASILLQRVLGWGLPPLGLALLAWTLYNSRGALRLGMDDVLHFPGHPPVPLDAIDKLDVRLWDRKGIAYASYTLPDGTSGNLRIDDFVYQRPPTDAIFDRVKATLAPPETAAKPETPAETGS